MGIPLYGQNADGNAHMRVSVLWCRVQFSLECTSPYKNQDNYFTSFTCKFFNNRIYKITALLVILYYIVICLTHQLGLSLHAHVRARHRRAGQTLFV